MYLTLGALGVIGSLSKIGLVGSRYAQFDLLGPLVVMSAIVIRLIKTRADIEGWNKLR